MACSPLRGESSVRAEEAQAFGIGAREADAEADCDRARGERAEDRPEPPLARDAVLLAAIVVTIAYVGGLGHHGLGHAHAAFGVEIVERERDGFGATVRHATTAA